MSIKHPSEYQPSYIALERNRVDIVAVDRNYAPSREDAVRFENVYFGDDVKANALHLLSVLFTRSKKKLFFVNANQSQIDAVWELLRDSTQLDVRNGTLGYNGFGLTIYK